MTALSITAQNPLVRALHRAGLLTDDLDYHVVRASMVIMFFFGYQKWFPYEFERLVPFISNGPLIWWLYPVFGHAGASYFLGLSEWTFGSLLLAGLGQAARRPWRPRLDRYLHRDGHYHSVHA